MMWCVFWYDLLEQEREIVVGGVAEQTVSALWRVGCFGVSGGQFVGFSSVENKTGRYVGIGGLLNFVEGKRKGGWCGYV